jgi:hypothetical protein
MADCSLTRATVTLAGVILLLQADVGTAEAVAAAVSAIPGRRSSR